MKKLTYLEKLFLLRDMGESMGYENAALQADYEIQAILSEFKLRVIVE